MGPSSVERKIWVAVTGAFLCVFLVVHLAGNVILFLPPDEARATYNAYSAFLVGNPLIKVVSYVLYAAVLKHVAVSIILARRNRAAAGPKRYLRDEPAQTSAWASRNMMALGLVLLLFLVLHMRTFWYEYHFGTLGTDAQGHRDLYAVVVEAFSRPWYVAIYVASMAALGLHLVHGVGSAGTTLGVNRPRDAKIVRRAGIAFALVTSLAFAALPLWMYLTAGGRT